MAALNDAMKRRNRIDEDAKLSEILVLSAKNGQWENVFEILDKKTYLINLIPETRRWGVLHQAMYWNDEAIMKKLLAYPGCDVLLRSKACRSEKGDTLGKTAKEIADMYGHKAMVALLSKVDISSSIVETETFASFNTMLLNKGLAAIGIAGFKTSFHPSAIDIHKDIFGILGDLYKRMYESEDNWKKVRDQVCDTLAVVNTEAMKSIEKSSETREKFFASIVGDYTREETYLYDHANSALRRQTERNYYPSAEDLALSPYIIVYMMILMYWPKLKRESAITYRRVLLTKKQMDCYQIGKQFTWLGFVSSSKHQETAVAFPTCRSPSGEYVVVFEIDNKLESNWQPRNVDDYACYQELERVYPAGAKFQVIGRSQRTDCVYVNLRLAK